MPPAVAAFVCAGIIIALFVFEAQGNAQTSSALWIPTVYLFVIASRPVSLWLNASNWTSFQDSSEANPIDAVFYFVLQVLSLGVLLMRWDAVSRLLGRTWPFLLFYGFCLVSLVWSDDPYVAFKRWVKLLGDLMMVLVVVTDPQPLNAIKRWFAWTGFLLLPLSLLFVKYYPDLGRGYDPWTGMQYFHGVSYNKNGLGVICLYWGIGFVWLLMSALKDLGRGRRELVIAGVGLTLALQLLVMSSSATSLSCFLMGTILIVGVRARSIVRSAFLIHLAVMGMILVPFTVLFLGTQTGALEFLQRDSTLTGRTELWAAIFRIPINPLVGVGYESFWMGPRIKSLWQIFWWRPTQAHNGYIETYVNLGWTGLALLAVLLVASYQRAMQAVRRGAVWAGLALACVVVAIPYNFTEATFRMQNLPWIFLLMAGMGVPEPRTELASNSTARGGGRNRRERATSADGEAKWPRSASGSRPKLTRWQNSLA